MTPIICLIVLSLTCSLLDLPTARLQKSTSVALESFFSISPVIRHMSHPYVNYAINSTVVHAHIILFRYTLVPGNTQHV